MIGFVSSFGGFHEKSTYDLDSGDVPERSTTRYRRGNRNTGPG
jgi:hypothetical protein